MSYTGKHRLLGTKGSTVGIITSVILGEKRSDKAKLFYYYDESGNITGFVDSDGAWEAKKTTKKNTPGRGHKKYK